MRFFFVLLSTLSTLCYGQASGILLALPLVCEVGTACPVQQYVDHDGKDYKCGSLTYDGHTGTDIRIADLNEFDSGVPVLAAARGRVRAIRDDMPDINSRAPGAPVFDRNGNGNAVVIDHGDGWSTLYAHMRRGSVKVRPGDYVEAGDVLGTVGMSGKTQFPHLHFEVRRGNLVVDPFIGVQGGDACSTGTAPLWTARAARTLEYRASGVVDAGISGSEPKLANGELDRATITPLLKSSGAVVFWAQIYGLRAGDVEEFRLIGPDGKVMVEQRVPVARNLAQRLASIGKTRRILPVSAGTYRGEYALIRGTEKVVELSREVAVSR